MYYDCILSYIKQFARVTTHTDISGYIQTMFRVVRTSLAVSTTKLRDFGGEKEQDFHRFAIHQRTSLRRRPIRS